MEFKDKIKLSIIMPIYNEEKRISYALESVLYQNVNFNFEIIVIDDHSTDKTVSIIKNYQQKFSNIILLINEVNRGKGYGFKKAYELASGEYFHVLDGDDFFTSYDKLQRQTDFLDAHDDHVAVAHNSLILFNDNRLSFINNSTFANSHEYKLCIENRFYYHTSSFMYRKLYKELPDTFLQKPMRGDSAVFFYHVYHSKKKVMYLQDLASIYNYHEKGLWSGISEVERQNLSKDVLQAILDNIIIDNTTYEYQFIKNKLETLKISNTDQISQFIKKNISKLIDLCIQNLTKIYHPEIYKKVFRGMYGLRFIDQLCETIGRIIMIDKGYLLNNRIYDENKIVILISGLVPNCGGFYKEINELIKMHLEAGKKIDIFSSNLINTDEKIIKKFFTNPNICYWQVNNHDSYLNQIENLIDKIYLSAPSKIYPFITHHDAILNSVIQKGLGKNIIIDYVYDHGLSLGIFNSSIDKIIIKTASQANALSFAISPKKLLYIPVFLSDKFHNNLYHNLRLKPSRIKEIIKKWIPKFTKNKLYTASAAARSYKVESEYEYSYLEMIPNIIKATGGIHYHYGPLSNDFKEKLFALMKKSKIGRNHFVHINWVNELSKSMLGNGVDIFISPFPIRSARTIIELMSCGMPLLNHHVKHSKIPQAADFSDPNQLVWFDPDDLYTKLKNLNKETLLKKSQSARKFYEENNEYNLVKERILKLDGIPFKIEKNPKFILDELQNNPFYKLDPNIFSE